MRVLALVGFAAAIAVACGVASSEGTPQTDPSLRSPDIVIVDGAEDVQYGGLGEDEGASYTLRIPYPAEDLIRAVSDRLRERGWTEVKRASEMPRQDTYSLTDWRVFIDGTIEPPQKVASWSGRWRHSSGAKIEYMLRYHGEQRALLRVWIQRSPRK